MKQLVDTRLTYDQVKDILKIPSAVGAKITAKQFEERTAAYWKASRNLALVDKQAGSPGKRPSSETGFGSG